MVVGLAVVGNVRNHCPKWPVFEEIGTDGERGKFVGKGHCEFVGKRWGESTQYA